MSENSPQTKILAQAVYEIRLLLSGYLGSQKEGDPLVCRAAHLAYALHNDALAVIEGGTFNSGQAIDRIRAVDALFQEAFASRFAPHASKVA